MTQREVELVRRTSLLPADPGSNSVQYAVVGMKGAVSFSYLDWADDAPPERRAMDTEWVIRFGHTLFPMGEDLGYHGREPLHEHQLQMDEDCHLLGAPCWYDGSSLMASSLLLSWVQRERDMEWLWTRLAGYYHDTFYGGR